VTESEPDSSRPRIDDADFSNTRLHAPNFNAAKITDGWFANADVSGFIRGMRVNEVEIEPLVMAELDRRFPERVKLRAVDPRGLAEAWELIEGVWATTVLRARELPLACLSERVDGEWSFVETLRHLVFATDCWFSRMICGLERPYHPWGLAGSFPHDPVTLGVDVSANPELDELLDVRRQRMADVKAMISTVDGPELERVCRPPSTPGHPDEERSVLHCLHVILDEEWEHSRYANRDLDVLMRAKGKG
jgi:hypothetical protein